MKAIGTYYPMDAEGRILNRASVDHIHAPWTDVVEEVIGYYRKHLGEKLHSVWIRGSVPAGTAVEGVSDLDSFAFCRFPQERESTGTKNEKLWTIPIWAAGASTQLTRKYPFVQGVEFITSPWTTDIPTTYPQLLPMIRTQAVKVYGEEIKWPGEQPRLADLKRNGRWIEADWEAFQKQNDNSDAMRTFIKTFVRGAFEEVMEREGKYATDLYPCIESVTVYRPDWREKLEEMVDIFCEPLGKECRLKEIAGEMIAEILGKTAV